MTNFDSEYTALSHLVKGNLVAFNYIYHKYSQSIYSNIFKYVKDQELAEDILQDVFLTLWEKRTSIKTDCSIGGWLYTVSYHKSVALLKNQIKEQIYKSDAAVLAVQSVLEKNNEESDYLHKLSLLEEAVNCLPTKKQQVFRLNKFEHKNPEEISEALGLTVISVKHYLKQSTKQIKQYVQYRYPIERILLFLFLLKGFFRYLC